MNTTQHSKIPSETELIRIAEIERAMFLRAGFLRIGARLSAWFKKSVRDPMRRRNQYKAEYQELMSLGDSVYRDLGISRGHLAYAMRHGRETERGAANRNEPIKTGGGKDSQAA
jgi:hypothetical protein